eukprot:Skav224689  [mRNA]  locus=scaffold3171:104306:107602:+ [translate_table: standard]
MLDVTNCRPPSIGKKKSVFPLPLPANLGSLADHTDFLEATIRALNSMHGCSMGQQLNATAARVVKRVRDLVDGSAVLKEPIVMTSFKDFFSTRGLDYAGEEVKLARNVTWAGIAASLPDEVGNLDIREFCEGGVLEFINNFENYLVPEEAQVIGKTPRTMVLPEDWDEVASGLVERGLCEVMMEEDLFHVGGQPLLNGLFAVSKDEFSGSVELLRLIMNLKPLNGLVRPLEGDTATLPSVTSLGTLFLDEDEVLCVSSADIRCFFYLFQLPRFWFRYLGFGKPVPKHLLPVHGQGRRGYLVAKVLPMGFVNSVAVAQHIHRNVVRKCMAGLKNPIGGHQELRRDKPGTSASSTFRVYLDNYDQLERVSRSFAETVRGEPSPVMQELIKAYESAKLPVHPKKTVHREVVAEVQGAVVNGDQGTVSAKPSKVARYIGLVLQVLGAGRASQRELQVIGGGLVYVAMFKRPLLCGLNHLWRVIVELESKPPGFRVWVPRAVMLELARFVALVPLASMNLRAGVADRVSASDASTTGGGVCVSRGLSPYGVAASRACVRGDIPEVHDFCQVLLVGLFDGISALRVAADVLGVPIAGHIAVEKDEKARRVTEANFPEVISVFSVEEVSDEMVLSWSLQFSNVGLVILGAGPPCQGVSGLNSDRRGALRDSRSCLFQHVPRVKQLLHKHFRWAQVHSLVESVASMDSQDCGVMNASFDCEPWYIDAANITLAHRPRVYWVSWELCGGDGVEFWAGSDGRLPIQGEVRLVAEVDPKDFLEPGCRKVSEKPFPTFTTSRPSPVPLRRPAGLAECEPHELERWQQDMHRFPPYQYRDLHCVLTGKGEIRTPSCVERELILGFPLDYTKQCLPKARHGTADHTDARLTLLGNTWCIPVISWLLGCLVFPLGLCPALSLQQIVSRLCPGCEPRLQSLLLRSPLRVSTSTAPDSQLLVKKLCGLVSLKGQDLLLQSSSSTPVRFHRLRASVPAKLWRWATIAGWRWRGEREHINVLELRAAMTAIRYRIEELGEQDCRCVHLVDSLVVLHSLARGRSSSRKLRRTLMRINSLLLVSGLQPTWAYVDTHQNPADKPSRRPVRKPWVKVKRRS